MTGIFRKYDIRGIYPEEINDSLAYSVGRALVEFFSVSKFAVGRDHRKSSPQLQSSLIRGIVEGGADVIDLGFCSSPELYNYNVKNSIPGIMITASHNPMNYNGIKINSYDGRMINYGSGLEEIESLVLEDSFKTVSGTGNIIAHNHNDSYVSYLISKIKTPNRKIKVVIDSGNGTSGNILKKMFSKIKNISIVPLFFEPNNTNPSHQADPTKKENLVELSQKIRDENADFGAAFDGDSDRCIFLDERGIPINSDIFMCIIADYETRKTEVPLTFYFDLWSSRITKRRMKELGCEFEVLPLGVANYREKLILEGGTAAAEFSGHIMFSENYSQDDGFFTLIKMIEYYGSSNKTMSAMIAPYMIYFSEHESLKCDNSDEVLENIKSKYSEASISELDGITIEFKDWWFNIRKSNTEPLLRFKIEANSLDLLKEKIEEIKNIIKS